MTSKGGLGDSPVSSRSGMNGHLGDAEKNGAFVHERAQEYSSEPWQDNRSVFRKLKDWWLVELLGCLLSIGASCGMYKTLCNSVLIFSQLPRYFSYMVG